MIMEFPKMKVILTQRYKYVQLVPSKNNFIVILNLAKNGFLHFAVYEKIEIFCTIVKDATH